MGRTVEADTISTLVRQRDGLMAVVGRLQFQIRQLTCEHDWQLIVAWAGKKEGFYSKKICKRCRLVEEKRIPGIDSDEPIFSGIIETRGVE